MRRFEVSGCTDFTPTRRLIFSRSNRGNRMNSMKYNKAISQQHIFIHSIRLWTMFRLEYKRSAMQSISFFYQKMCTLFKRNAILCLFLKNVSPSKRKVCFILNNLHCPMEGIAFYALHKSRVLIIPCKADDFCLFIGLSEEI